MFSFFKSSKKSPVATPTDTTKAEEQTQKGSDDFVLIGGNSNNTPLYPNIQTPSRPAPPIPNHQFNRQQSFAATNYTANIPFKLNPVLVATSNNDSDLWGFKMREMSATFQRISATDYDFKLERSIVES